MKNLNGKELNIITMLVMCYMKACKMMMMIAMMKTKHRIAEESMISHPTCSSNNVI